MIVSVDHTIYITTDYLDLSDMHTLDSSCIEGTVRHSYRCHSALLSQLLLILLVVVAAAATVAAVAAVEVAAVATVAAAAAVAALHRKTIFSTFSYIHISSFLFFCICVRIMMYTMLLFWLMLCLFTKFHSLKVTVPNYYKFLYSHILIQLIFCLVTTSRDVL